MDEIFAFSENCLQFVAVSAHGNSEYIVNKQDELHENYFKVVNVIRTDLGIEVINDSLKTRLSTLNS
jgi:hypothetical protein